MVDPSAALDRLRGVRVAVIGDLMLDEYVWGDVARVSPDAPVQVVDVRRRTRVAGGAANVAHNLAVAGATVALAGVVGADAEGDRLLALVGASGVDGSSIVRDPTRRTTVKTRVVARGQQLVRLDEEDRRPVDGEARTRLLDAMGEAFTGVRGILVSDYAKGVVHRGSFGEILATARARAPGAPVVVDPKAADLSIYRGCDAITPNAREAEAGSGVEARSDDGASEAANRILAATGASCVLVTRGERGMTVAGSDGTLRHVAAAAREVFDVTGAGDTVLAYFGLALAAGVPAHEAAELANAAAGVAVGKVGTSAVAPPEVAAALSGGPSSRKLARAREAVARVEHERSLGRRVVFTNGCFDLLHAGHVHLLERARALGDLLVVAINSDASVRRLKGPERPVVGEDDRVRVLSALDAVGLVIVFDEDTPLGLIDALRPDVLVKGGDYSVETIVGAELVLSRGGSVETVPLVAGRSTSGLVSAIRRDP